MCSSKCLLNALMLSESPLIKILMLTLRGLTVGVLSSSHLLKLALSRRALPTSSGSVWQSASCQPEASSWWWSRAGRFLS